MVDSPISLERGKHEFTRYPFEYVHTPGEGICHIVELLVFYLQRVRSVDIVSSVDQS